VYVVQFSIVDLAASLTASKLYRAVAGSSVVGRQVPHRAVFRGYIAGMSLSADASKSAGVATFEPYVEDVAQGMDAQLAWTTGVDGQVATFEANKFGFSSDDRVDVRVTTDGSFTPTTVDVLVDLYLVASNEAATS
jgi:hypothetical protein